MQPLFTQNFLSHYLPDFKLSNVPNIRLTRAIIENLIQEFNSGKFESLKEEEFKSRFINEFFGDVLGFNYGNSSFWTLREEPKTEIDGTKPDGALGFFTKDKSKNDVRAVIEIKDFNTGLDEKQKRRDSKSPVTQVFEYASKIGENCKWAIVSNIKETRFYSSSFQGKYQVFYLEELSNEDTLKELLFLFHKDRFIKKGSDSSTDLLYKRSKLESKENEKPKHIVDIIYDSLIRFKGLNYVDPNYLASIKPFNILNEYVWHYSDGCILTLNPKIYDLFKHIEIKEGIISLSSELICELEENKVTEYLYKLNSFFKFLNHSGVVEISCIKDYKQIIKRKSHGIGFSHKHKFHFSDKDSYSKNINILKYNPCDCISCNFKKFDFKLLLTKLKVAEHNDDYLDLEYAYGNYLVSTNNYKTAYNIYRKLSDKTKGKEGFEVEYFISKLNMKSLQNLIWEDERLPDSFEIREEARNIDLNRILYEEIEYSISDDVRNYLLKIKDEKLIISAQYKIDELVSKIHSLKQLYDNGGTQHSGSNIVNELGDEYYQLQIHFNKNRIIYTVFHKYKLLTEKVFNGLIESYQTKGAGLIRFNSFFLIEFIINLNPAQFKNCLLGVENIPLDKDNDGKIAQNITNLFNSYMEEGLFATPYKSTILQEYLLDLNFNNKYTYLISNSFTLLAKIDLSEKLFGPLKQVIIDFIRVETDLAWHHLKEFRALLIKKGKLFSSEELQEILKIAVERDKPNNNKYEGLIKSTSETLNKFYPNIKVRNRQLIKKAIGNIDGKSKWIYASYLLLITDDSCGSIINDEIEEMLDLKFDSNFYEHLIRNKLFDYKRKDYFERYVEKIKNCGEVGFTNKFEDDKPVFEGYTFFNFILLINILTIDKESELLKNFNNISSFEEWLLNPTKYDYSDFDIKWILAADNVNVLKSLKGIEELKNAIKTELRRGFNPILSEIYYNYLL